MGGGGDSDFQRLITGSIASAGTTVDISSPQQGVSIIQVSGTWVGTLLVEGSNDGLTFYPTLVLSDATNLLVSSITQNTTYVAETNGYQFVQIRATAWTSGTATINVWGAEAPTLINSVSLIRGGSDGTVIGNNGDSLKVSIVNPSSTSGLDSHYNEISAVASGSETNVISFTATGAGYRVSKIFVSGENIALFKVKVNGITMLAKRTFFGNLNEDFTFDDTENGLRLASGDQVAVTVLHNRPFTGSFESTILGVSL